jgi:hypothetical protein
MMKWKEHLDGALEPSLLAGALTPKPWGWEFGGRDQIPQREFTPPRGASLPQRWAMSGSVPRLIHRARRTPSPVRPFAA